MMATSSSKQLNVDGTRRVPSAPHTECVGYMTRRGMTMLELLVVVSILLLMTVIALPTMMPSKDNRRMREAARSLNMFFGAARARAMELNRPVGVWCERLASDTRACNVLYGAEVPPIYSGDTVNATVKVQTVAAPTSPAPTSSSWKFLTVSLVTAGTAISLGNIHPGDLFQFNCQGPLYTVYTTTSQPSFNAVTTTDASLTAWGTGASTSPILLCYDPTTNYAVPPWTATASQALSFKVWRQPRRVSSTVLQLPPGTVIDLQYSGSDVLLAPPATIQRDTAKNLPIYGEFDQNRRITNPAQEQPVVILFSPAGNVDSIYCWQSLNTNSPIYGPAGTAASGAAAAPINTIYLLLGMQTQLQAPLNAPAASQLPPTDDLPNWLSANSLWMTIRPRTGQVKVAVNRQLIPPTSSPTTADRNAYSAISNWIYTGTSPQKNWQLPLLLSRSAAREAEGMGGL